MKLGLTRKRLKEIVQYNPRTGIFTCRRPALRSELKPGDVMGDRGGSVGYQRIRIDGQVYAAHRLAWLYMMGSWPTHIIDHKNGKKRDNKWANLRDVPTQWNTQNQHRAASNNSTGYLGVSSDRGFFKARIKKDGKLHHIGHFPTAEMAHQAYLKAKRILHEGCLI